MASRRAARLTPAQTRPPGPHPKASSVTSVVPAPSTAALAKKRNAVRAPLHHSRAVLTYIITEENTPRRPLATTTVAQHAPAPREQPARRQRQVQRRSNGLSAT